MDLKFNDYISRYLIYVNQNQTTNWTNQFSPDQAGTILFPLIIEGPIDIASAKDAEGTNKLWLHSFWLSIESYMEISVITPCYEKR